MEQIAGQIQNFATEEQLHEWSFALSKIDAITIRHNDCHGVNEEHVFYNWFMENIFSNIKNLIADQNLVPTFGMYLNETKPWGIHTDGYHVHQDPTRKPAISFLMPLSVDNKQDLVSQSHTIVFNQSSDTITIKDDIDTKEYNNRAMVSLDDVSAMPDSAMHIYKKHLSHNVVEDVQRMTVQGVYQWTRGSLIWWQGQYFHDTDNFLANGHTSKQALVIHTHYEV
jgi:hypothetical protein|tara:strand:- start:100 stop:774 length:675 start_codon:yes stop_codon:yes gene_type:complete